MIRPSPRRQSSAGYTPIGEKAPHVLLTGAEGEWPLLDAPGRNFNDSCDPNASIETAEGGSLQVRLLRQVHPSEEIAIAYDVVSTGELIAHGDDPIVRFWHPLWSFDCRCGSPLYRGRVDGYAVMRPRPGGGHNIEKLASFPIPFGPNPAITVREIPGKGRGVVAKRRFRPGEEGLPRCPRSIYM